MLRPAQKALILAVVLTGCSSGSGPNGRIDPYQVLPGKWGWEGSNDCHEAPLDMHFSKGGKRMHLSHSPETEDGQREPRREANYTILGVTPMGLSMSMDGEDRLDASGQPATWDLVMLSNDQYCWHRSDWRPTGCTKPVNRCEM
jgi:hypothetical protein